MINSFDLMVFLYLIIVSTKNFQFVYLSLHSNYQLNIEKLSSGFLDLSKFLVKLALTCMLKELHEKQTILSEKMVTKFFPI